jgi:predicted N-acetyltransferase YhbS
MKRTNNPPTAESAAYESMAVRPAVPGDVPALLDLVQGAYRGESARRGWTHEADLLGGQRIDAEALGAVIGEEDQCLLVAEDEGRMIGCVQISAKGGGLAYLGLLSVDPEVQAAGLGKRLIAAAEAEAVGRFAARRMEMTVIARRGELIAYYERRGYALTGEMRPFPIDDPRFGLPMTGDLDFVVLAKALEPIR